MQPPSPRRSRWRRFGGSCALLAVGALAMVLVVRDINCRGGRAWLGSPDWVEAPRAFPPPADPVPPATPLAPLLARDQQEELALVEPAQRVTQLSIGQALRLRFNRPMVQRSRLYKDEQDPPFVLQPAVPGRSQWTSPSTLSFQPDPSVWRTTRTCSLTLPQPLTSLGGEPIGATEPRTVVFDATPRFVRSVGDRRLPPGTPIRLLFEGNVRAANLDRRLLVYETGGGNRQLDFYLTPGREDQDGFVPVELRVRKALEPGASFAIALSPTLDAGGSYPRTLDFELLPPPRIEGLACSEDATSVDACRHREPPAGVIDFPDALVFWSSAPLGDVSTSDVSLRPAVAKLSVEVQERQRLVLRGDWVPDQVYEARLGSLRGVLGERLAPTPPLAVRSRGRTPEVRVATGRRTYEIDADPVIHFAAVHVDEGAVQIAPVPEGRAFLHVLDPDRRFAKQREGTWKQEGLGPLVPEARPNRWGQGKLSWYDPDEGRTFNMAFVSFVPALREDTEPSRSTSFVQRTDLGLQAKILPTGTLVWVTSIQSSRPLDTVNISVVGGDGQSRGQGVTDDKGVAWIPSSDPLTAETSIVQAMRGKDRAILVVDPRTAIRPSQFGLYASGRTPDFGAPRAVVFTDRGLARRGETMHVKVVARQDLRQPKPSRPPGTSGLPPMRPLIAGTFRVRVMAPGREAPLIERALRPSKWGSVALDMLIPSDAPLGTYNVEVRRIGLDEPITTTSFVVLEVKQPAFHVDIETDSEHIIDKEPMPVVVNAVYPFGAPAAGRTVQWLLTRAAGGSLPVRWKDFVFGPADASTQTGTVQRGETKLDERGRVSLDLRAASSAPLRESATLEVTVKDVAGRETAARTSFTWYPAQVEVGLRRKPGWTTQNSELEIEAIAIARDGSPLAGKNISARFVREGWRRYWTWSDRSDPTRGEQAGGYRLRAAQRRGEVHHCMLVSGDEPVRCRYQAERPGTYLLEVETQDEAGRWSVASQRVYVAGPDEQPDRDPPGTAITLSPKKATYAVGEQAEVAFESPFPEAEALIVVERDAVLYTEHRRVGPGGQIIRVPVSAAMTPNAFVSVALARPRTGAPAGKVDLDAPDLRLGMTEIRVTAPDTTLRVKVRVPEAASAGHDVPVDVEVTDEGGKPVACELAVFAVDEGTLRLTGYVAPDPAEGLIPRRSAVFLWDGLRRNLVSRVTPSLPAVMGGDGPSASPAKTEVRDAFDPTPLWAPQLETDPRGLAHATLSLPKRAAEYRVMAVAVDRGARSGKGQAKLVAERTIVVRPSLPRFVTEKDRFEAAVVVHNLRDKPTEVKWSPKRDGGPEALQTITLQAHANRRLSQMVEVPSSASIEAGFIVRAGDDDASIEASIPVVPRGRWEQATVVGSVRRRHEMALSFLKGGLPDGGRVELTAAAHPFVGFGMEVERLESWPYAGAEATASALLGLASYASLGADVRPDFDKKELRARAATLIARLGSLQTSEGGFGHGGNTEAPDGYVTTHALRALLAAKSAGWELGSTSVERATQRLTAFVLGSGFLDADPDRGRNDLALALRVLAEADAPESDRVTALYDQREHLSPEGLAYLALAMDGDDDRRSTLLASAVAKVLATPADERRDPGVLRWWDTSNRTVAAVVEAVSRDDAFEDELREMVTRLVRARAAGVWRSSHETSVSLAALSAYAARFRRASSPNVRLFLDGNPIAATQRSKTGVWFSLPLGIALEGSHTLAIESDAPAFFALNGRWSVPLGPEDDIARGRRVALHRVIESDTGKRLEPGDRIRVGDLVRVRLFVFTEESSPPYLVLNAPFAGGLEPVDAGLDTTPQESLRSLLGMGVDDDDEDPRGALARQSLWTIGDKSFESRAINYHLSSLGSGLYEYTHGARATVAGTFTIPPASIEARYVPEYAGRSATDVVEVVP
jgi:alpha-2-macroglobulin